MATHSNLDDAPAADLARHVRESTKDSRDAERALCRRYAARIEMYGMKHLRDRDAAQDLAQQVLLTVIEALREGRVEEPQRLDAFVLGTCRHMTWDMHRADGRQRDVAERATRGAVDRYEPALPRVDRVRLEDCIRRLANRDRAVVWLTFVEDRSADEIGSALTLEPGNVRVIRHRALAQLQQCVDGAGVGGGA